MAPPANLRCSHSYQGGNLVSCSESCAHSLTPSLPKSDLGCLLWTNVGTTALNLPDAMHMACTRPFICNKQCQTMLETLAVPVKRVCAAFVCVCTSLLQAKQALQDLQRMDKNRSKEQQDSDSRWGARSFTYKVAAIQAGRVRLGLCLLDRTPGQRSTLRTRQLLPSNIAQVNLSGCHTRLASQDIGTSNADQLSGQGTNSNPHMQRSQF